MKNINWAVLGTGVIANEMAVSFITLRSKQMANENNA